ncbi:cyclic GMP-binding protein C-like isoform X1 [Pecten maximus]|uniref:cyclic GMP-binding protein C-like isoform X1 n=1 Tax=Pecten maximus TaxID=6579 RepID=UPI001458164F|nr:cyclic GMP-binding protein C-like isoform X1 [Pecten maximus]XP_033728252.1 cyclic GMP-binding protein C-like isoform X1 [Pecten maximus]
MVKPFFFYFIHFFSIFSFLFLSSSNCLGLPEPDEIRDYDRYLALFKGQTENYRHIRVVFTGRDGAGKTTLCRRLQNKYVDIKLRQPTLGAILHPVWFSIDWKDKVWEHSDDHLPTKVIEKRMGAVLKKTKTPGMEDASTHSEQPSKYLKQMDEALAVKIASNVASLDAAYISLWDMGGHTSFQASHNVFISSHGVYLLVFRLTDFLRDRLETDRLKKWIRLIGTFSSVEMNAPKIKTHAPPIIFVGTFLDELKKSTTDYEKHVETIRLSISKFPELSELHFAKFCTVDNSLGNDETDLEILRDFIIESAVHQDQWDRQLPTTWLKFEMELQKAREKGTKILALAEVIEQNKSSIAPLTDEDDIKLALEYLHCTRSVVYFRGLDYVIIDPQWLADFFSILITDDQFLPKDDLTLTRDLELYKSKGELTQKLIEGLLNVNKNQAFIPFKSILLALMEKFGLIVKIRMSGTTTAYPQCSETYTIPSKLKELRNISDITGKIACLQKQNRPFTKTICFVFNDVYLPEELFHRIFSGILRKYRPTSLPTPSLEEATGVVETTEDNTVCLYSGFGCFEVDDLCRMILSMHIERSTIAVTVFSQTESQLPMDSGRRIRL